MTPAPDVAAPETIPERPSLPRPSRGELVSVEGSMYRTLSDPPPTVLVYRVPRGRKRFQLQRQREGDTFLVTDLPTGIFGSGSDLNAAIRDFYVAAAEHLDVLERQDELSDELAAQREYLRARVRR